MQIMTTAQDSAKSNPEKAQLLDNYSGNWIWRAVECLVKSKDFNPSPKWIADRLSISIENAVDAIEGLEKLRLITRTSTGFAATGNITLLGVEQTTKENLLKSHSYLGTQIISKLTAEDLFTTQIFLGNKDLVKKYAPKIIALLNEMSNEGLREGKANVMALEISFVNLTSSNTANTDTDKAKGGLQ